MCQGRTDRDIGKVNAGSVKEKFIKSLWGNGIFWDAVLFEHSESGKPLCIVMNKYCLAAL